MTQVGEKEAMLKLNITLHMYVVYSVDCLSIVWSA